MNESDARAPQGTQPPRYGHKLRVVLAEDDPDVRCLLKHALKKDGHVVIDVRDGSELFKLLQEFVDDASEAPDLVVSDIRMPGKSGLDVLASVRELGSRTPFVLTTGFGDAATHAKARELGAIAVFDKPFDVYDLRTVVLNVPKRPSPSECSEI